MNVIEFSGKTFRTGKTIKFIGTPDIDVRVYTLLRELKCIADKILKDLSHLPPDHRNSRQIIYEDCCFLFFDRHFQVLQQFVDQYFKIGRLEIIISSQYPATRI